jgi:hypothetical protein
MTATVSTAASLYERATELKQAVLEALATTAAGAPDRHFVSPGIPAFDCCPFVCVQTVTLGLADTSPLQPPLQTAQRAQIGNVNLAALIAYVVRCVPVPDDDGSPPSAAALDASGATVNADGFAVWNHLKHAVADQTLFPGCRSFVYFDGAVALDPAGGCGGWTFTVRLEIPGFA